MCIESEQQLHEQGVLGHDYISMSPEAVALRALIDHIGTAFPQPDPRANAEVENMSVDDTARPCINGEAYDISVKTSQAPAG